MTHEEYQQHLDDISTAANQTLGKKNIGYSSTEDALFNFTIGSDITGLNRKKTCWGYMTKHLAALRKMIEEDEIKDKEDFKEKIVDSINYLKLLYINGMEDEK